MRKTVFGISTAVILVLLTPALWLGFYRIAHRPLPVAVLPDLTLPAAVPVTRPESTVRTVDDDQDMVERILIRAAFDLIPRTLFPTVSGLRTWELNWRPTLANRKHGTRIRPQLHAWRENPACHQPACRDVRSIFVRLQVLSTRAAAAQVALDWLVYADTVRRGLARMTIRRSGTSWELVSFDELDAPPPPKDEADIMHQFYDAPLPVFRQPARH